MTRRIQIALLGHGYQIDLLSQTLSIEWEIVGCGAYRRATYLASDTYYGVGCDSLDRAVDIYFNRWDTFNPDVRDLYAYNQQRIRADLFIRPSQIPPDLHR